MMGNRLTYGILLLAGLFLMPLSLRTQTFSEIDTETYRLYLERDWNELIRAGRDALKKDIDYYYLRMRIGIAYHEKKNYKTAQNHFRRALGMNQGDPVALEYLYYAYLLAGQTQQAALLYKDFPESLKERIPPPELKPVNRISAEYLYSHLYSDDPINDPGTFENLPLGVWQITRSFHNLNVSMNHQMHPGTSFTHAYTYMGKSNFYYFNDGLLPFGVDGQKIRQHQYYLSPSFTLRGGLVISPAFHYLRISYQIPYLTGASPGPGGGNNIGYTEDFTNQMVGGFALALNRGPFRFDLKGIYSSLNRADQVTASAGLTWYPLGNMDLYLGAGLHSHIPDLDKGDLVLIPDGMAGFGIASKVWIEISGSYGDMQNYTESNGYIIYNGLDWMRYKVLGNLIVPLTGKGSVLYAGARFAGYENRFIPLYPDQTALPENLTYTGLSVFGGLSWKF